MINHSGKSKLWDRPSSIIKTGSKAKSLQACPKTTILLIIAVFIVCCNDLGPTKQFDVETIREALRLYEDNLAEKFETAKPNSIERIEMGAKKVSAQTLIVRLSRRLPLYAD